MSDETAIDGVSDLTEAVLDIGHSISNAFGDESNNIRDAIIDAFGSACGKGEESIIGSIKDLSESAKRIAYSITPPVAGNKDASGGHVESLTEAVMGVTGGLCKIAEAIESLAEAVRSSGFGD